ncbi:MAG: hypothetical protein Q9227_001421 [Pyrenula ochraceoflavens]
MTALSEDKSAATAMKATLHQSRLAALPPEIVSLILKYVSTLRCLNSLIHTSSYIYACYRLERESILRSVLCQELPVPLWMTAEACLHAPTLALDAPDSDANEEQNPIFNDFMKHYAVHVDDQSRQDSSEPVVDVLRIADLHATVLKCVQSFTAFVQSQNPKLYVSTNGGPQLSYVESYRLARAFYRFELICGLYSCHFGTPEGSDEEHDDTPPRYIDLMVHFFSMFPPWEIEEIASVYEFIYSRYHTAIEEVQSKKEGALPRTRRDRFDRGDGIFNYFIDGSSTLARLSADLQEGLASRGLQCFLKLCIHPSTVEAKRRIVQANPVRSSDFLSSALNEDALRDLYPPEHFDIPMPDEGSPLSFEGDQTNKPSIGWVRGQKNEVDYSYAESRFAKCREVGYVFWDKERYERMEIDLSCGVSLQQATFIIMGKPDELEYNPMT